MDGTPSGRALFGVAIGEGSLELLPGGDAGERVVRAEVGQPLGERILEIHGYAALTLAALVAAHIGGALMHGVIKQDGVINRMIGWWPLRKKAPKD